MLRFGKTQRKNVVAYFRIISQYLSGRYEDSRLVNSFIVDVKALTSPLSPLQTSHNVEHNSNSRLAAFTPPVLTKSSRADRRGRQIISVVTELS